MKEIDFSTLATKLRFWSIFLFRTSQARLSLKHGTENRRIGELEERRTGNLQKRESLKRGIFKSGNLWKKAEQALEGALVKFHYRGVDRLKNKYRKLKQVQSRRSYQETNQSFRKAPARNRNTSEDTLLEQMRAQANNKKVNLTQLSYLTLKK